VSPDGVLVIGYGSELRGDDAAGPVAARRLAEHGFRTLAVHQLTPEIAEAIASARVVFFIDADTAVPPGEASLNRVAASSGPPERRAFEHHASPAGLLNLAKAAYGASPEAWFVGLGVGSFEIGEQLSPAAEEAIARAVAAVSH